MFLFLLSPTYTVRSFVLPNLLVVLLQSSSNSSSRSSSLLVVGPTGTARLGPVPLLLVSFFCLSDHTIASPSKTRHRRTLS